MNIRFIIPGKCRERYINDGVDEYIKRLSRFAKTSVVYVPEESLPENASDSMISSALEIEAERELKLIKDDVLFLVDIHAKQISTERFASIIKEKNSRNGNFVFLFGSSYGLSDRLRKRADFSFSLSEFTFTHYMALYLTVEQVYRAMKINSGERYDK